MLGTILGITIGLSLGIYIIEHIHKYIWKNHSIFWIGLQWATVQFLFWTAHFMIVFLNKFSGGKGYKVFHWTACYYTWAMCKSFAIDQEYKFDWWRDHEGRNKCKN
jgi:hypothetical protein